MRRQVREQYLLCNGMICCLRKALPEHAIASVNGQFIHQLMYEASECKVRQTWPREDTSITAVRHIDTEALAPML